MGIFSFTRSKKESLDKGLEKTKESVFKKLSRAVIGKTTVDDEVLDNLEDILISADVGVKTTLKIITRIEKRVAADKYMGTSELNRILKEEIVALLAESNSTDVSDFDLPKTGQPYVIMVVGVNGVGKTTTIGKLAHQFKGAGKKVVLGAADTFRAAAIEQLQIWAIGLAFLWYVRTWVLILLQLPSILCSLQKQWVLMWSLSILQVVYTIRST